MFNTLRVVSLKVNPNISVLTPRQKELNVQDEKTVTYVKNDNRGRLCARISGRIKISCRSTDGGLFPRPSMTTDIKTM